MLGTLVAMDGRFEAIEDINVGDLVVSRDDETWEDGTQPVNATFGEHHESVLQVTYVIESDWFQFNKQVVTTAEHPFMVASVGWTPAAEMYVGDRIVTLDNEFARIVAIEEKLEPQYAYNFEVDEFHTYAVTEDLLWVHNECDVSGGNAPESPDRFSRSPKSIQDQMTLQAANEGQGEVIMRNLNDPKFKGMDKVELKVKSDNGNDSVVHYVRDPETGDLMDFKFKKHSTEGMKPLGNDPKVPPGG